MNKSFYFISAILPAIMLLFYSLLYPEWRCHVLARFYENDGRLQTASSYYSQAFEHLKKTERTPELQLTTDFLNFATEEMLEQETSLAEGLIFLAALLSEADIFARLEAYGAYLLVESPDQELANFTKLLRQGLPNYALGYLLEAKHFLLIQDIARSCQMYAESIRQTGFSLEAALFVLDYYLTEKRYADLVNLLIPHEAQYTQNCVLLSGMAQACFNVGNFSAASQFLERFLHQQPTSLSELRLLGQCGVRLGRLDYVNSFQKAFALDNNDISSLLLWAGFMIGQKQYDTLIDFFSEHSFSDIALQKIYYQALREKRDIVKLGKFLQTTALAVADYPEINYFLGLYYLHIANLVRAKSFFKLCISSETLDLELKKESFEQLFALLSEQKNTSEVLNLLQQWIRFDPSNSELYLKIVAVYEKSLDVESALREIMVAQSYFPTDVSVLTKTAELLLRQKAPFRLITLLSDFSRLYHYEELVIYFCQALVQTGEQERAKLVLEQYISSAGIDVAKITKNNLSSAAGQSVVTAEQSKFLEIYNLVQEKKSLQVVDGSSREKEKEFLNRLSSLAQTNQEKNSLPPPLGLSNPVHLQVNLKRPFNFKGKTKVYLPLGTKVEFMAPPPFLSEFLGLGGEEFYLVRYRGKLHRVNRRYLRVMQPQRGEAMGEGYIADIDGDYDAIAEVEELFDRSESFEIVEAGSFADDRMIRFDDDNYVKFFSIPKLSYTLRCRDKVYFHFPREPLQISGGYDFLREEDFADILEIPTEQRLALFGPHDGAITILHSGTRRPFFRSRATEKLKGRYRGIYDRVFYRGYLILDVNNDGILDYLSLWQSKENLEQGFLHILASAGVGRYQDFILLTALDFISGYRYSDRIPILHFLRDLNEDGILEFVVHELVSFRANSSWGVSYSCIYNFSDGKLQNISAKFPLYMREEKRKLAEQEKRMLFLSNITSSQLAEWQRNYEEALVHIDKLQQN